jgi:hypothetical protein
LIDGGSGPQAGLHAQPEAQTGGHHQGAAHQQQGGRKPTGDHPHDRLLVLEGVADLAAQYLCEVPEPLLTQ